MCVVFVLSEPLTFSIWHLEGHIPFTSTKKSKNIKYVNIFYENIKDNGLQEFLLDL